jgi:hypothetical protein
MADSTNRTGPRWRSRRGAPLFFCLYGLLALALLNPTLHGRDGLSNYAPLRSLLFDGDLHYGNDYALFDQATGGAFEFAAIAREPNSGRPGNRYGIGSAVLWAPFVSVARLWGLIRGIEENGLESRYAWAVGIGSVFWAGVGLWLVFAFCRRTWGRRAAWVAAASALGLSPLAVYVFFHVSMSHAPAFFSLTAFLAAWEAARRRGGSRRYALAGALGGLAALVRVQDAAVVMAVLALEAILSARESLGGGAGRKRRLGGLATATICGAVVFIPQTIAWRLLYGSFFSGPAPYLRNYPEFNLLRPVHAGEVLFSSNHGVFFWHPLLAVGLVGLALALARRKRRMAALGLAVAFLATWHLTACWQVWHAGASFGNRFYISILLVFAAGWAAVASQCRSRLKGRLIWAVILLGTLWNAGLAVQYGTEMAPRQGKVAFTDLARNQFTRVPGALVRKLGQAVRRSPQLVPGGAGTGEK